MRIAIADLKGGTGKTTTAIQMAALLSRRGRTLLVDADAQGSALSWSEMAGDFPCAVVGLPVRDLHKRLDRIAEGYEHVVIDTPPTDVAVVRSALFAADTAIIPLSPSMLDLDRLRATIELLADVEPTHPIVPYALLTRVRAGTNSAAGARAILGELGVPLLGEIPLREAHANGFGLTPSDPEGWYGRAVDALCDAVAPHGTVREAVLA